MNRTAAVLGKSIETALEPNELSNTLGLIRGPWTFRRPNRSTIDLLLIHSPTARPLPPRNGVRRWEYRGRIYREVPLEALYARDDEDRSTRGFCQMESLMRAKPHRRRAA